MRKISHWSPRYIIDRLSVELFRRKYDDNLPCLGVGAIQFLNGYLSKCHSIFEYGSGYSTSWFAQRAGNIISVESNNYWYDLVKNKLAAYDNAEIFLIDSIQNKASIGNVSWDYVNKIKDFEKESFDLVLNDGYARALVAHVAIDYVKKGGIFCWDDFGHSYPVENSFVPGGVKHQHEIHEATVEFLKKVESWKKVVFDDGVHTTAFFFKP